MISPHAHQEFYSFLIFLLQPSCCFLPNLPVAAFLMLLTLPLEVVINTEGKSSSSLFLFCRAHGFFLPLRQFPFPSVAGVLGLSWPSVVFLRRTGYLRLTMTERRSSSHHRVP